MRFVSDCYLKKESIAHHCANFVDARLCVKDPSQELDNDVEQLSQLSPFLFAKLVSAWD